MDRPRIICHILQSVDGNIDGDFFTVPEIGSAYREFARIREEFACDAVISGATTAAEIYRGGFAGNLPTASEHWPRTDRKAASAEKYAVIIDVPAVEITSCRIDTRIHLRLEGTFEYEFLPGTVIRCEIDVLEQLAVQFFVNQAGCLL